MADSLTIAAGQTNTTGLDLNTVAADGVNPLDKFQSFNSLFTLAGMTKQQLNQGTFNKEKLINVVCRSQGDWAKSQHVQTDFGSYDYFIDDLIITSIPAPHAKTGVTQATKITFKVFEPYSMGLFMLAMQQAAEAGGYKLNFKEAPFMLMIEWVGYTDNKPGTTNEGKDFYRLMPIRITNIRFKVGTSGTTYEIDAIPYNEIAFRNNIVKSVTDVRLSGNTVLEVLAEGDWSLLAHLQRRQTLEREDNGVKGSDHYQILFPKDFQEVLGGKNIVGDSPIHYGFETGGVQPFQELDKIWSKVGDLYQSKHFKMEDNRVWHFTQEASIPEIITEVIIRSEYIVSQMVGPNFKTDENGMVNWFRIETQVEDWDDNPQLGRQQRSYIYRIIPYKVHVSRFLPPNAIPPGYDNLRKTVAREYNYIYTGKNTEILDIQLNFDLAWFTPVPADLSQRVGQKNAGTSGMLAGGKDRFFRLPEEKPQSAAEQVGIPQNPDQANPLYGFGTGLYNSGTLTTQAVSNFLSTGDIKSNRPELQPTSQPVADRDYFMKLSGGTGSDVEATSQARTLQYMLTNPGDMIKLDMEIMGDPYYIPSSGMGNQIRPEKTFNLLKDGSLNYQSGEVDIIVNFRTPIDLNPVTGLYKFEKAIDMWSGLYQVLEIESKFNGGKFTQRITANRRRSQYGGVSAQDAGKQKPIFLREGQGDQQQGGSPQEGPPQGGSPQGGSPIGGQQPATGNYGGQAAESAGIPQSYPGFGGFPINTGGQ